jgi:hypothetical protein
VRPDENLACTLPPRKVVKLDGGHRHRALHPGMRYKVIGARTWTPCSSLAPSKNVATESGTTEIKNATAEVHECKRKI